MNTPKCPLCAAVMTRHGKTRGGAQRWRCRSCNVSRVGHIDSSAKQLQAFLAWLLGAGRQADMPGAGRTFRRHCQQFWCLWPLSPIVDEVHEVIFVDGIHLGRKAVVLIARSRHHVLGWYVARNENSRAWAALLARIAPPQMVVTDGGSGFEKARRQHWPDTMVQRCTFHVFGLIKTATTTRPKLEASRQLYALGLDLIRLHTRDQALGWVQAYQAWTTRWQGFLNEKTTGPDGKQFFTHAPLVKARNSLNRLLRAGVLFSFLDPGWETVMPAMNNQIEGATNAPLRQMLRDHRGLGLTRRIKAIFWWCYMHTEAPLPAAKILKTMPTDAQIEAAYQAAALHAKPDDFLPRWGDAITWRELHHTTPYHNDWD